MATDAVIGAGIAVLVDQRADLAWTGDLSMVVAADAFFPAEDFDDASRVRSCLATRQMDEIVIVGRCLASEWLERGGHVNRSLASLNVASAWSHSWTGRMSI